MIHCPTCRYPRQKVVRTFPGDDPDVPVSAYPLVTNPENDNCRLRVCLHCGTRLLTEEVVIVSLPARSRASTDAHNR